MLLISSRREQDRSTSSGISLVEVLVALVVLAVSVAGTSGMFSNAITSIFRTGDYASQASVIEADIARVQSIAVNYNACTVPSGSIDNCPGQALGNSFYYFPGSSGDIPAFFAACNAPSPSDHITNNFIAAVNALPQPGSSVTRETVVRAAGTPANDHAVVVRWSTSTLNNARVLKVAPVVSSWCN